MTHRRRREDGIGIKVERVRKVHARPRDADPFTVGDMVCRVRPIVATSTRARQRGRATDHFRRRAIHPCINGHAIGDGLLQLRHITRMTSEIIEHLFELLIIANARGSNRLAHLGAGPITEIAHVAPLRGLLHHRQTAEDELACARIDRHAIARVIRHRAGIAWVLAGVGTHIADFILPIVAILNADLNDLIAADSILAFVRALIGGIAVPVVAFLALIDHAIAAKNAHSAAGNAVRSTAAATAAAAAARAAAGTGTRVIGAVLLAGLHVGRLVIAETLLGGPRNASVSSRASGLRVRATRLHNKRSETQCCQRNQNRFQPFAIHAQLPSAAMPDDGAKEGPRNDLNGNRFTGQRLFCRFGNTNAGKPHSHRIKL